MKNSLEGIYRNGRVELLEPPPPDVQESRVLVTFMGDRGAVELTSRGIEPHAADLRARLRTFAEDWDRPEMDVYDQL